MKGSPTSLKFTCSEFKFMAEEGERESFISWNMLHGKSFRHFNMKMVHQRRNDIIKPLELKEQVLIYRNMLNMKITVKTFFPIVSLSHYLNGGGFETSARSHDAVR